MGRSLVSGVDCFSREWDPRRRDVRAVSHHGDHVVCRIARAAMVVAADLVHLRARGDGRNCASAAEFVSLPCDLDITTLDTRHRAGVADSVSGVSSNNRRSPSISAQTECAAMGRRALPHVVVARVSPDFRGGSKPRDRHLLWRPNIWRVCDATANVDLGARSHCSGVRNRIHSLLARSKRLSNVGSASARGRIWLDR